MVEKATGKDRNGSKRRAEIPELVVAVLKEELETLVRLQGSYQCRQCFPGRPHQFALVRHVLQQSTDAEQLSSARAPGSS